MPSLFTRNISFGMMASTAGAAAGVWLGMTASCMRGSPDVFGCQGSDGCVASVCAAG